MTRESRRVSKGQSRQTSKTSSTEQIADRGRLYRGKEGKGAIREIITVTYIVGKKE